MALFPRPMLPLIVSALSLFPWYGVSDDVVLLHVCVSVCQ